MTESQEDELARGLAEIVAHNLDALQASPMVLGQICERLLIILALTVERCDVIPITAACAHEKYHELKERMTKATKH